MIGGALKSKKLIVNEMHTKQYVIKEPGQKVAQPYRGNSSGPIHLYEEFQNNSNKPNAGVSILNLLRTAL